MNMIDIIRKKRDGGILSDKEIRFFVDGISSGSIPDYQASALLMALFLNGTDARETTTLTLAMAASGAQMDLSAVPGVKVDKHSTGGVADTTTLILVPLVAACGVPVVKMSGRGLGFTGGTLDKLESIPGFRTALEPDEALRIQREVGAVIMGQTADLCPADRILYALRDVTATVESIPLIAASIMSKKLASGADAILLDVTCGSGAFMKTEEDARALAKVMVDIGNRAGRKTEALITAMDQPVGRHVGNALEVIEAIRILSGREGGDLLDVTLALGARMLCMAGRTQSEEEAVALLKRTLSSGVALDVFRKLIAAQGGNPDVCDDEGLFPIAQFTATRAADRDGFITGMDAEKIGQQSVLLGAGRKTKDQEIDPGVGLILHVRIGDHVRKGDQLATVYARSDQQAQACAGEIQKLIQIGDKAPDPCPVVRAVIT